MNEKQEPNLVLFTELMNVQTNRQIKQLVFSGGGAKGIVYPGMFWALTESGAICKVSSLAGTSIGAISAALVAMGISKEELRNNIMALDVVGMKGTAQSMFLNYDAKPLIGELRRMHTEALYTFFGNTKTLPAKCPRQEFEQIKMKIRKNHKDKNIEAKSLTFAELHFLNKYFPDQFKDLRIVAVRKRDGAPVVFHYSTHPNVEIASACRASASIPYYFEPFTIDGEEYVDGAVYDNIPTEHFEQKRNKEETLVCAFGNKDIQVEQPGESQDDLIKAMHYGPETLEDLTYEMTAFNLAYDNWGHNTQKTYQEINKNYALRTLALDTRLVGNLSFAATAQYKRELDMLGYLDGIEYVIAHELYQNDNFEKMFIQDIIQQFEAIYTQLTTEKDDLLLNEINIIRSKPDIQYDGIDKNKSEKLNLCRKNREVFQCIRDHVNANFGGRSTFALTLATEVHRKILRQNNLTKQCSDWLKKDKVTWVETCVNMKSRLLDYISTAIKNDDPGASPKI